MSTDQQQYSIENQQATIQRYAAKHGFAVVKTYSDAGRSGVLLRNRPALRQLLKDVMAGQADFKAVLVYDVSRWGRFEDADESAHYEFLCRSSQVPVHYCAESFASGTSLASTVMRAVKRAMAAEFSRELSNHVFAAEKRWAEQGFKQGGPAGYGLQRVMVSADGTRKQLLAKGETKCLQSDRVVLAPGDPAEVHRVREMFRMVLEQHMTPFAIAAELNKLGASVNGHEWKHQNVSRILTNPKYAGHMVWNRDSMKLGSARVRLPKSDWVVRLNSFEPVVAPELFLKVQEVLAQRTCCQSNEQILERLRGLLASNGKLTIELLQRTPGAPSAPTCSRRFGSARRAFELASYTRDGAANDTAGSRADPIQNA